MTGARKLIEPLTEEERKRLFDRIHRSPRIPDRYLRSVTPAKAGMTVEGGGEGAGRG